MKTKECPYTLEIWKPIVNYEDKYEISNFGNIKSLQFILKKTATFFNFSNSNSKPNKLPPN